MKWGFIQMTGKGYLRLLWFMCKDYTIFIALFIPLLLFLPLFVLSIHPPIYAARLLW